MAAWSMQADELTPVGCTRINGAMDFTAQRSRNDRTKIKLPLDRMQIHSQRHTTIGR
jgi:hypothetical protein